MNDSCVNCNNLFTSHPITWIVLLPCGHRICRRFNCCNKVNIGDGNSTINAADSLSGDTECPSCKILITDYKIYVKRYEQKWV